MGVIGIIVVIFAICAFGAGEIWYRFNDYRYQRENFNDGECLDCDMPLIPSRFMRQDARKCRYYVCANPDCHRVVRVSYKSIDNYYDL